MIVARALKNSQLICGERHAYFGDRTLGPLCREDLLMPVLDLCTLADYQLAQ
jgi:hypothetical protein